MGWARRQQRRTLRAFVAVLVAAIATAAIAVAAAGGGDDVDDIRRDDPGERRGPTESGRSRQVGVATPIQLLPLAKRTGEIVARPSGVSVQLRSSEGRDTPLTALCTGQVEVALAERRLSPAERRTCVRNGVRPTRRRVGHQAVAVYASRRLAIECLTLSELRRLVQAGSAIERYSQLDASLPARPVRLLAPASGRSAFELFTRVVLGAEGRMRGDARTVRDTADFEHILAEPRAALGVYGVGLVGSDDVALDTVAIDAGDGCVFPRHQQVRSGRYPLAEPLYAYARRSALRRRPVADYFETLVERAPELADYPGVVPPPKRQARG